jgi:hypothetical protein
MPTLDVLVGPVNDDAHADHRAVASALDRHRGLHLLYRVWPAAPVDEVLLTLPLEVEPPLLLLEVDPPLLDVDPPLEVDETTMLPLDPELPPPKKPPPKPPLPPKKPPLPPITTGTPPPPLPPKGSPNALGSGAGWFAMETTVGAQAVVVVVVTTRVRGRIARGAGRAWATRRMGLV